MCISENWMLLTVVSVATTQSTLDKFSQNFRVGNQYQIDDNIFGTNDAYDYINEIQTVELDRYKDNLSVMVQMVLDKNIKPIIIGPGLHDPKMAKAMLAERGRPIDKDPTTNQRLLKYSETAKKSQLNTMWHSSTHGTP